MTHEEPAVSTDALPFEQLFNGLFVLEWMGEGASYFASLARRGMRDWPRTTTE